MKQKFFNSLFDKSVYKFVILKLGIYWNVNVKLLIAFVECFLRTEMACSAKGDDSDEFRLLEARSASLWSLRGKPALLLVCLLHTSDVEMKNFIS